MSKFITLICFLFASLSPGTAVAEPKAPDVLIRDVTNKVLDIVRTDAAVRSGDIRRVVELAEVLVLPHFDFRRMTMLAVGRDWRDASPEQQARLIEGFRTLLVRTYANAFTQYRDERVEFPPSRFAAADTRVQVRTEVVSPGAQPISIDYMLEKGVQGWKVIDVVVAGVSLVTNYRSSFSQAVRNGGVDGLIRALEARNNALATEQGLTPAGAGGGS